MSGKLAPKLVRCPKCWLVLPEPPHIVVYQCGGCGTTLQAKKRKSEAVNSESSSTHKTVAGPSSAKDLVSKDKQQGKGKQLVPSRENGMKAKASSSSSGECSLDGNAGRGQNENGECNGELLGPLNLSEEELEDEVDIYKLSLRRHRVSNKGRSNELTHSEIEATSVLMGNISLEEANDRKLELPGTEVLNNGKLPEGAEEELTSATDEQDGNNGKSSLVGLKSEVQITRSNVEEEELRNGSLSLEGAEDLISGSDGDDASNNKSSPEDANHEEEITRAEESNDGNLLLEEAEEELSSGVDGEDANNDKPALVGANPEVENTRNDKAREEELYSGKSLLEGTEKELNMPASDGVDPNNDQSAIMGANFEVDITGSASTAKMSITKQFVSEMGSTLRDTQIEEGTTVNPSSSLKGQQRQAQKDIHRRFGSIRSVDTFDNTEVINPSSEPSGNLEELSKSPTTRSAYAYEGSISSSDAMDEQFPIQRVDSFGNTYTDANGVSEESSRKGKGVVTSTSHGDLETQHHQSYFPHGTHRFMKDSRGNYQNKVLETASHGHQHWKKTERDESPSRAPFPRSGSSSGESGCPSKQMHDEFYCSSSFLSPDSYEDADQEKMKLLRMIHKLQDQLNRTRYMSGETNGRLSSDVSYKGKHISAYHGHDLQEGRFYHGLDSYSGRFSHGINWHQRHKFSQIPYSAQAISSTRHVDHSCFHCHPQEWQYSADLSPHVLLQHEELCRFHPGHNCCSCNRSYPSSPQWFIASKLPLYGREIKSDDQRHRATEVKKYFKGKQNLANKRHFRPVAGGAPFVICLNCLKLLQLPADFLLFKKVCHQLKCGACSEVLKFSLLKGSHIVSYSPNAIGPPPSSDLNVQSEVINSSNAPSASHANYYNYTHADPITYSDDYGLSVSKSYSSEGDPLPLTPFHSLHGSEYDNESVSRGTFEPMTEKNIASRHSSTSKVSMETDESAGISSNMTSEIEAWSQPKSSPLHQLMGYSSPSQVMRGTKSPVKGKEPILNAENDLSHEREK